MVNILSSAGRLLYGLSSWFYQLIRAPFLKKKDCVYLVIYTQKGGLRSLI